MTAPRSDLPAQNPPPSPATDAALAARILIETESVLCRPDAPFTFTSGRISPVYVDVRRLIAFPRARARLMAMAEDLLVHTAGAEAFDVVAGGETAGIPYAAFLAERLGLPMCYVRKKPKGFGRDARIEGNLRAGQRALLVEDLATDGGSKLSFVEALREAGAEVAHCFVVFHYGIFPESVESLAAAGVQLHALATWRDVIEEIDRAGYFPSEQLDEVRSFLIDPKGWSETRGGT